ncbi:hypothetical protein KO507_02485 [Gilvimarinus agarilyticus]|uniref:hypothetical protein n=1 Tax=Gilvimarinus sp. 2_MG-2023 TaxID=3062666 RepID=UPI001C0A30C5|nr:hypothetical protein [Gilvimarinus sp. 2_MG-2023]MBU2884627.1 hypothetical protein [Gilvimarinus agarilyticus]MDO6569734.1 hypothetical protein [Gilvimarinus sp. 2_MG-2023]
MKGSANSTLKPLPAESDPCRKKIITKPWYLYAMAFWAFFGVGECFLFLFQSLIQDNLLYDMIAIVVRIFFAVLAIYMLRMARTSMLVFGVLCGISALLTLTQVGLFSERWSGSNVQYVFWFYIVFALFFCVLSLRPKLLQRASEYSLYKQENICMVDVSHQEQCSAMQANSPENTEPVKQGFDYFRSASQLSIVIAILAIFVVGYIEGALNEGLWFIVVPVVPLLILLVVDFWVYSINKKRRYVLNVLTILLMSLTACSSIVALAGWHYIAFYSLLFLTGFNYFIAGVFGIIVFCDYIRVKSIRLTSVFMWLALIVWLSFLFLLVFIT